MAPVPAPGIVALEAIWTQQGQPCENTFNYAVSGGVTVAKLLAIIGSYTAWASANPSAWDSDSQLVKLQARDLTSTSGASVIENVTPPISGTDATTPVANSVTFALKRQTGVRGRANRGRVYLIGVPSSKFNAGFNSLTSAAAAGYIGIYNDLLSRMLTESDATEVILHRALGTGTPVLSYAYSDVFTDSQRRRLPGHNRHH